MINIICFPGFVDDDLQSLIFWLLTFADIITLRIVVVLFRNQKCSLFIDLLRQPFDFLTISQLQSFNFLNGFNLFIALLLHNLQLIPDLLDLELRQLELVRDVEDGVEGESELSHGNDFEKGSLAPSFVEVVLFFLFDPLLLIISVLIHPIFQTAYDRLLLILICLWCILVSDHYPFVEDFLCLAI